MMTCEAYSRGDGVAYGRAPRRRGDGADELRIGLADDPDMLDPTLARTYVGRIVFASMCDKLVDISPELDIVPQLATEWHWVDDNKGSS
jgi:ABC-type transport system substrate-binding protein